MSQTPPAERPDELGRDTAVTAVGPGRWGVDLQAGWGVGGGLNGGYLLAVLGRALAAEVPTTPHALSVSAYYLSAARPGAAEVAVDVRRTGRTRSTVALDLRQGDDVRVTALATAADLAALPDDVRTTATPLVLPPVEECVPTTATIPDPALVPPLMRRMDLRLHPDQVGWAHGRPAGDGVLSGWFRLPDREPDPLGLLLAVDALPPVTFTLGLMGWAPTLELTAHLRAAPAPGWLRVRHATRNVAGGMFEEDCEVWDTAGRLVAQSRQLALLPR